MRILFLQKRPLFPADTGGKIRTLNVLRHLARWHNVTYLCNVQPGEEEYVRLMQDLGLGLETIPWQETPRGSAAFYGQLALNALSPYPYNVAKDYDRRLKNRAQELLEGERYDLVICDFVQMARNAIRLPGPPKILFEHNVEAEVFHRQATSGPGCLRRRYMALQWRKMQRFEAKAGRHFDAVIAVSERDRRIFEEQYGWDHVHTIDTAVDVDYFRPNGQPECPDRILFLGSMDWLPNADGVQFFVREVWPRIRAARPRVTFQIVGRNPGADVQRLSAVEGVEVVGTVRDVRPYFEEAAVVVVPLLVGGGTRIKIFEAMAMGKAVVSTTLGAEGLDVVPGKHIELADQPDVFANTVVSVLGDPHRRNDMGRNARDLVRHRFCSEKVARQFECICRSTVAARKVASAGNPCSCTTKGQVGTGLPDRNQSHLEKR